MRRVACVFFTLSLLFPSCGRRRGEEGFEHPFFYFMHCTRRTQREQVVIPTAGNAVGAAMYANKSLWEGVVGVIVSFSTEKVDLSTRPCF
jgi:hypothetical protein